MWTCVLTTMVPRGTLGVLAEVILSEFVSMIYTSSLTLPNMPTQFIFYDSFQTEHLIQLKLFDIQFVLFVIICVIHIY